MTVHNLFPFSILLLMGMHNFPIATFKEIYIFHCTEDLRSELGGSDNGSGTGSSAALPVPKGAAPQLDAEKHFLPFELACQSKSARIVVTALDCIQV